MGIPGLWKKLKPAEEKTTLLELCLQNNLSVESDKHYTLGIDAPIWIFQALHSNSKHGMNAHLKPLFYRCCRLLTLPVHVIFVFDGNGKLESKRGHHVRNRTRRLEQDFRKMVQQFGFTLRIASGEAEAELAWLNQNNMIDGILSEDVDCFVFGALTVIREELNERSPGKKNTHIASPISVYKSSRILSHPEIGLSQCGLVLFALLNGGDYHKGFGCGPEISFGLARTALADTLVEGYLETRDLETWTQFRLKWRRSLCEELKTNSCGNLSSRRPQLSQKVPTTFPSKTLLHSYLQPEISKAATSRSQSINLNELTLFCINYFGWESMTVINKFARFIWPGYITQDLIQKRRESEYCNLVLKISQHRVHPVARSILEYHITVNVEKLHLQLREILAVDSLEEKIPKTQKFWIPGPILHDACSELIADYRRGKGMHLTDDELSIDSDLSSEFYLPPPEELFLECELQKQSNNV